MITLSSQMAIHNATTWFLAGLVWTVQLVHYPLFGALDPARFREAHAAHSRRISFVVGPAMVLEAVLAAMLLFRRGMADGAAAGGFALVLVIWASTAFIMIPLHDRLASAGRRVEYIDSLVRWNWIRTIAWTARGLICLVYESA